MAGNLILPRIQNKTHQSWVKEKVKYSLRLGKGVNYDLGSDHSEFPMTAGKATLLRKAHP